MKLKLNIDGMSCVNCAKGIEKSALKIPGVSTASVSFANSSAEFELDSKAVEPLKARILKLGYKIPKDYDELEKIKEKSLQNLKFKLAIAWICSSLIMILHMKFHHLQALNLISFALCFIVLFYSGNEFFKRAIKGILNKNYDMNVLVAIGSGVAFFYSVFVLFFSDFIPKNLNHLYFDGASMIISFILLGKFLEERAKIKASSYLKKLIDLRPKMANLLINDEIVQIEARNLKLGDIVVVKNGDAVPCDGEIIFGGAEFDTSLLTGESLPMYKGINEAIKGGSFNTNGIAHIRVTKTQNESAISQILELVSNASSKKMEISRFADKISQIFVPVVIFIAILTFFVWFGFGEPYMGILAAICVLIISCPCALGLATPVAIVVGIWSGLRGGILFKNPLSIEAIKGAKYIIFDKTGTLTKGEISVYSSNLDDEILAKISYLQSLSNHPISKAIVKFAKFQTKFECKITNSPGLGIYDEISKIAVGNEKLMSKLGAKIKDSDLQKINELKELGCGAVFVALDSEYKGFIALNDELKDDAKTSIENLKNLGLTPVILSGDSQNAVNFIAKKLQIKEAKSSMMPKDKLDFMQNLQNLGNKIIFVGDGVNDAPCLKHADIGIAMSSGSDLAKDAGDIILLKNDLNSVVFTINLANKTLKTIKQNLILSFIYNSICIPVATGIFYPIFGILLTPMYGSAAMSLSSISVVLNSLRLGKLTTSP